MRRRVFQSVFGLAGLLLTGCGGIHTTDLTAAGRVHVANQGSNMLDVTSPQVESDGKNLVVSGTVTRHAGFNGPVPGRLEITVLDVDGKTVLQDFTTGWDPPHVPIDGDRRASYIVRYGWLPPDGATVRVDHVPNPDDPDNIANGAAAAFHPHYRGSDGRNQLLDGLGGDRSWSYQVQRQRPPDVRAH